MIKETILIGVDPDIDKCGYAVWDRKYKSFSVNLLTFTQIIEIISFPNFKTPIHVVIEAGWLLKKSNWHGKKDFVAQKIAKNVGMNHAVGILLEQYCKYHNIPYTLCLPKGKVTAEYFEKITGIKTLKSQSELRDAGMLVYGL